MVDSAYRKRLARQGSGVSYHVMSYDVKFESIEGKAFSGRTATVRSRTGQNGGINTEL